MVDNVNYLGTKAVYHEKVCLRKQWVLVLKSYGKHKRKFDNMYDASMGFTERKRKAPCFLNSNYFAVFTYYFPENKHSYYFLPVQLSIGNLWYKEIAHFLILRCRYRANQALLLDKWRRN